MTGSVKIDHLQRWSQIIRSDRTETVRSFDFLAQFPKFSTEWKAPKVLKTIYIFNKRFHFSCFFLFFFFTKYKTKLRKLVFVDTSRVMILLTSRIRLRMKNSNTIESTVNHPPRRKRFPKKETNK